LLRLFVAVNSNDQESVNEILAPAILEALRDAGRLTA